MLQHKLSFTTTIAYKALRNPDDMILLILQAAFEMSL